MAKTFLPRAKEEGVAGDERPAEEARHRRKTRRAKTEGNSAYCANSAGLEPWEPPIPFDTISVPPFPIDALPRPLRKYVEGIALVHKVPVDLPAVSALGAVGASAARRIEVQIGDTHREPLNLYVAGVAASGERKKAAMEPLDILRKVERERQKSARPEIAASRERRQLVEARLKHLREQAAKAKTDREREKLQVEAVELAQHLPKVATLPRLLVSNTTPEKLEELLAENHGSMCMASEEAGSTFEIAAGRYAKDGGAQLDTLLLAYDGGDIDTARITRDGARVRRPALSIILTPQPTILRGFRDHPEFQRRGLIARFAFVIPSSLVGTRMYENRAPKADARRRYEKAVRRILNFPKPSDLREIRVVKIEGDALEIWTRHHDALELAQADGGQLAGIREWASKHAARVARIAAGMHIITCTDRKIWSSSLSARDHEGSVADRLVLGRSRTRGPRPHGDGRES
jgi:replicative DNA helicase